MGKKLLHICIIAAMIISMFTGIIPTPTASASTLGMTTAGSTDIAKMNKAGITDWKATIGAYDASTGNLIGTPTIVNKPALGTHKVTAPTIAGYTLFGYATQSVRISTLNHSPTVKFKYRKVTGSYVVKYTDMNGAEFKRKRVNNVAYGTYTETAIDVAGYTLQGASTQSITLSDSNKSGTITFKYKPTEKVNETKAQYTVIYEDENGAEFKRKTVNTGLNFDQTYTETAIEIDRYKVIGSDTQTVTLTEASPSKTITFVYEPVSNEQVVKPKYTVKYVKDDGAEFKRKTVSTGLNFDQAYTETAIEIEGYEVVGSDTQSVTLTEASPSKTITFTYKVVSKEQAVKPKYTVKYVKDDGAEFKRKTVTTGVILDKVYTEKAIDIKGYEVMGDAVKTVILTKDNPSKTITFTYKVKEAVKEKTGTYTVKYVNEQGAEFSRDTKRDLPFGDYTVTAKDIVNYRLVGEESVTFNLSENAPSKVVTFTYEVIKGSTVSSGGYKVTYVTDKGIQLSSKTLRGLPLGLYVEEARTFAGFELISDQEQSVALTNTKPNGTMKFVYKATASAEATTGSYTVVYEDEKGAEFSRKTEVVPFGTYEETAKEIPNFTPLNATQTVTVSKNGKPETIRFTYKPTKKPSAEPTISYTVIYKDPNGAEFNRKTVEVDYGTYTEKAKDIPYYKVKGDAEKTITLSKDKPKVTITFEYEPIGSAEKQVKGSYTVIYESTTGAEFSRKTVKDVDFGTYSEEAKTVKGYTVQGGSTKTVTVTEANPTTSLYFTYAPTSTVEEDKTGSYTVIYKDPNGAEFNRKTVEADYGTYKEKAKDIPHYKVKGDAEKEIILSPDKPSVIITFEYEPIKITKPKKGSYTVIFESTTGAEFSRKTVKDVEFGTYSEVAKTIKGYTLVGERLKEVKLTEANPTATIYFTYAPTEEIKNITTGTYTVVYEKTDGAEFSRKVVKDKPFGTYYEQAKQIDGYKVVGAATKSVVLSQTQASNTIIFTYEPKSSSLGSYTVVYEDDNGNEISRVVTEDVEFGEYSVTAPEITGYELQGDKVQKFYVLEDDKDTEIRFTYKYVGKGTGTNASYTVRYVDKVSGLDLGVVTYKNLRTGTYTVEGAKIDGYTLVSTPVQAVTLTKDKPSATIVFEYTPSTNLCVQDFVDTIEFKGSKSTAKLFSKGYHFSVNPSDFTNNKQYKITVTSKEGIYNVKIQVKSGSTWKDISTIKDFMDVTLYSDCFEDKVFLKLSSALVTSAVPHLNNKTEITLKVARSEQLVYKYNVNPFIDITGNAVVQNFRVRELVYGTSYESFSPNNYFTRAQMFAVISRGLGLSKNGTTKFKDLKTTVWYYNDVMRLNYVGIVQGSNGKANASGYTTANQLYLMLDRTSKLYGGKGISYDKYFKGYKKNDKIKRIDAVTVMSKIFVDLGIITE